MRRRLCNSSAERAGVQKAQGGNDFLAFAFIEQIERGDQAAHHAQQREEFAQAEIQKEHVRLVALHHHERSEHGFF